MAGIAKVVVRVAANREFDYIIPDGLEHSVAPGCSVVVPFRSGQTTGYVVGLADKSAHAGLKSIISVSPGGCLVGENILRLARWMADYYCAPIEHAVRTVLPGPVRNKGPRRVDRLFVTLRMPGPADAGVIDALRKKAPKQAALLDALQASGGMFLADLINETGASAAAVRAMEKKGLVATAMREEDETDRQAEREVLRTQALTLMPDQANALALIKQSIDTFVPRVVLLHGVTGSGKTEVYLQAIEHVLARGRGAIVLVPEISLTPQTLERFRGRFGDTVGVLHSHLTGRERRDEWRRLRDGAARIAVGARSAVFAPVVNPGLIVVDEEHDTSYKQDESPRYNARDVAVMRGTIEQCPVLLGSATPCAESYANSQTGKYAIARLPVRVDHRRMPVMRVVDMRREAQQEGRVNVFSRELVEAVRLRLERGEQTILFLNRRGYATSMLCPKCGHVSESGACSIPFTYHKDADELRCHVCGAVRKVPEKCPGCSDKAFKFSGIGTQRVESIVTKLFPHARVHRMDSDSTGVRGSHARILGEFRTGKLDILVGTQMIAKGLDFPNVTLIGIIYADIALHMPDFRAAERAFQLLTQVAGRAGRGDVPGEVIVQTFTPQHPAVQAALKMDYEGFHRQEAEFRKELRYPPFAHLVCITVKGNTEERVSFAIEAFARSLQQKLPDTVVLAGPAPAPMLKAKGDYRYQVMLRSKSVKNMVQPVRELLGSFKWPANVTCSVDVDAVSLM